MFEILSKKDLDTSYNNYKTNLKLTQTSNSGIHYNNKIVILKMVGTCTLQIKTQKKPKNLITKYHK